MRREARILACVCTHAYTRMCGARWCTYTRTHAHICTHGATSCVRTCARTCGIRQFAIYCLDFNLPSEWPWALPPLPTDIRRRKLPIVSMELDSYCAPTFMPAARERTSKCACANLHIRNICARANTHTHTYSFPRT